MGAPWPLGPQTNACVSTHLLDPWGGAWWAPSLPDPAGYSARLCNFRQVPHLLCPLSIKCKGLLFSNVSFSLGILSTLILGCFFCLDNLALRSPSTVST